VVIPFAWGGPKDRSHDGNLCSALLSTKSGYFYKHGYLLCAQFCHHYA